MTWLLRLDYLAIITGGAVCSLLVTGWNLLHGYGPIGAQRILRSSAWVAALALAQFLLAQGIGANAFAIMMIAWIDLAMVVPAAGLMVLLRGQRRATRTVKAISWLALLPLPLAMWASLIEPTRLVVERPRLQLPQEKDGQADLRIAVLADLQTSRVRGHEARAIRTILDETPDVILIPGDVFQGWMGQWEEARAGIRNLLARLKAPGGVYMVSGNSGYRAGLADLVAGTDIQLLVNRAAEVTVGDRRLHILGLEDSGFPRRIVSSFEGRARSDPGAIHLILVHRPGAGVDALGEGSPVDLVVSGHTHGGQVVLPGFGPPLTLSSVPREVAAGGLHVLRDTQVYVSRGVGMERKWAPRIRFLCPPEVTLLTLTDT